MNKRDAQRENDRILRLEALRFALSVVGPYPGHKAIKERAKIFYGFLKRGA